MELTSFVEWRVSRDKLRGLERTYATTEQAPASNPSTKDLSLRSLKRMIDQIRGEVIQFESRIASIGRNRSDDGSGPMLENAVEAIEPVVGRDSTPVWSIAELWNQGVAAEDIPQRLPGVEQVDVFEALHDYLKYREEIDRIMESKTAAI